jgi:hypothetical protein
MADADPRQAPVTGLQGTGVPDQPYQSISLQAIIGFSLALFFSIAIALCAISGFIGGLPMLFPLWTILIPIGIGFLCVSAQSTVRASEGTLGGGRLAGVGLAFTLVSGLAYWSYYTATYLAYRQQSTGFLEAEAFRLTLPASDRPPAGDGLRDKIETTKNGDNPAGPLFTRFSGSDFVRYIRLGGGAPKFSLVSASAPEFDKGVPRVQLVYQVDTPFASFQLDVPVQGYMTHVAEGVVRKWNVIFPGVALKNPSSIAMTKQGDRVISLDMQSKAFYMRWLHKAVPMTDPEGAYRETLPAAEQAKPIPEVPAFLAVSGSGPLALSIPGELNDYKNGPGAFFAGDLVRADDKTFWAAGSSKELMIAEVKSQFQAGVAVSEWLKPVTQSPTSPLVIPQCQLTDDKVRFSYDMQAVFPNRFLVGCTLTVEAPIPAGWDGTAPLTWRVVSLDLVRGRTPPPPNRKSAPGRGA